MITALEAEHGIQNFLKLVETKRTLHAKERECIEVSLRCAFLQLAKPDASPILRYKLEEVFGPRWWE